ncbi:valine--tRNA ligase [Boudabousia liubingyangii]|uniref:Valine--tRNA ligase n=1 Tax=Boudabousia liubingyangii TaxID=1921764 RepID=A0A1Q5PMX0_9ACTO|nr:valine--tRNA ligase [Boudabousia liubingyangii]OKL48882.1 valine--tRNA ligase [Boudabousia liubingyangii]
MSLDRLAPLPEKFPTADAPDRVSADGLEAKWGQHWEETGTFTFEKDAPREDVFSIDTPPPTVSGSLHVGHVFSYTHTDVLARFQRMNGKAVFYPMGWDDNGLPTERRVQNYFGVRCDPTLPYEENFVPPHEGGEGKSIKAADQKPISRKNFIELCQRLTADDEQQFESLWRHLGLSVDWNFTYQTIGDNARKVAQAAFLGNLERGEAYQAEAPGLWDVTFQTAVAQAELEAREYPGHYHSLVFRTEDGKDVVIETTRPELLPACVALIAHPDDERYQHLFGTSVTSPVFNVSVPVLAHPAAEKDKGAGIAMCCTFGDITDVQWWRELELPMRSVLRKDGRLLAEVPEWITDEAGRELYERCAGKTTFSARKEIVEALQAAELMLGEPKPTQRMTNFFEKGDKPLEIVTSRQWYIRNGGREFTRDGSQTDLREELVSRGQELAFHPDFMRVRYENWVKGLNTDWLISRQRFFGVSLPLWYRITESGDVDYQQVLTPELAQLPVDPSVDCPPGFSEDQRDVPGGFTAEIDIMDTWATSSLTPLLATGWLRDENLFKKLFPMTVRPQGQDIIRTWLFSTVVRSHLEFNCLPWQHATISGWILDPDRKKMSKSKGNVVTPMGLLEKHGSDAVRYWAASARLGTDATFDEAQMKVGRRLAIKLLNASKFALTMDAETHQVALDPKLVTQAVDRAVLAQLAKVVTSATEAFEAFDHTRALEITETFFWHFTDDYLELVKERAYNRDGIWPEEEAASARAALALVVNTVVRLLAPFLPYSAEEVWSWYREGSVHLAAWPTVDEFGEAPAGAELLEVAAQALMALRKIKSEAKVSPKTPILKAVLSVPEASVADLEVIRTDLEKAAVVTGDLVFEAASVEAVEMAEHELGEPPAKRK